MSRFILIDSHRCFFICEVSPSSVSDSGSYMYGQFSCCQSCCFYRLFIDVGMQNRDVYATLSSEDGAGICSLFAFKAIYTKTALFLDMPQKLHFQHVIINVLWGILS